MYVGSQFVPHFSSLAKPLWDFVSDQRKEFVWTKSLRQAFVALQEALWKSQTRAHFDPSKCIVVQTDACALGLGAVLLQDDRPILFASRTLSDTETRYSENTWELCLH